MLCPEGHPIEKVAEKTDDPNSKGLYYCEICDTHHEWVPDYEGINYIKKKDIGKEHPLSKTGGNTIVPDLYSDDEE